MAKKKQSKRLTNQHKKSKGVVGIFGEIAKSHDLTVREISNLVMKQLEEDFPQLTFQYRTSIKKEEINEALKKIDPELGQTLFVSNSSIKPDGGIIEVKDDNDNWRIVLVSEAKHQGKDIENIKKGKLVGKDDNQDLMAAGNAIERSHKNISEIANFMLSESHFPYILFLEGSNFLTETISIKRPDGRVVVLEYSSGMLNRLDRLTELTPILRTAKFSFFSLKKQCCVFHKLMTLIWPFCRPKIKGVNFVRKHTYAACLRACS